MTALSVGSQDQLDGMVIYTLKLRYKYLYAMGDESGGNKSQRDKGQLCGI